MKIDPRIGAMLEQRYHHQVNAMYGLVQRTAETLEQDKTSETITHLDLEHENLFNLFDVVLTKQNCPLRDIAWLYMHLSTYLVMRGMYKQLVTWGINLFEWYKQVHTSPPAALFHCIALGHEGLKQYEQARFIYIEVMPKHYRADLSPRDLASIHYSLSRVYYFEDDIPQAAEHISAAIENDQKSGDARALAMALAHYSELLWYVDDHQTALDVINEALRLGDEIGNMMLVSTLVGQKAKILAETEPPETVIPVFEGAIQLLDFRNDEIGLAQTYFLYGEYLHKHGRYADAYTWMDRSLEIAERYQLPKLTEDRARLAKLRASEEDDTGNTPASPTSD